MKISVGHIVIVAGIGAYLVLGPLQNLDLSVDGGKRLFEVARNKVLGVFGVSEEAMVVNVQVPTNEPSVDLSASVSPSEESLSSAPPESTSQETVVNPEPVTVPPLEEQRVDTVPPAPREIKVTKRRRARSARTRKAPSRSKTVAQKSDRNQPGDANSSGLVGRYVALKLKTGREVKGILEKKTATSYTVELPGMGPLVYPVENVESVKAIE